MAVRLTVLLARRAPVGVVFRRGPSKQVLMCLWRADRDEVIEGQWLKGRVYEHRCDLSPNGKLLVYFAANYEPPYFSWTAVSRPPFFTAVALWPKGDGWGGGGLFSSETQIQINHRVGERCLAPGFELPHRVQIVPFGDRPGWGEDSPIWDDRLRRDGWIQRSEGSEIRHPYGSRVWFEFSPPVVWSRPEPRERPVHELCLRIHGIKERDGPWYVTSYEVRKAGSGDAIDLGRCDWADWSLDGDLLVARSGQLLRIPRSRLGGPLALESATWVVDLTDRVFVAREAPSTARTWFTDVAG